jgi:hypothetical protein
MNELVLCRVRQVLLWIDLAGPPLWSSGQSSCLQRTEMYCDSCEVRTEFIYVV